jgi:hypothetical protein
MPELILKIFTGLYSPLSSLAEKVHKYREKLETKEQFVDAFENEMKSYQKLYDHFADMCQNKFYPVIMQLPPQPLPLQIIKVVDSLAELPKIFGESIVCFIGLARACSEVSKKKGFMDSLSSSNRFLFDFVGTMSDTYVKKDTVERVRIDGSFFRFFNVYKKQMVKAYKKTYGSIKLKEKQKREIKEAQKRIKIFVQNFNEPFLSRYSHSKTFRKWKFRMRKLEKTALAVNVENPTKFNMDSFIPEELRPYTTIIDEVS